MVLKAQFSFADIFTPQKPEVHVLVPALMTYRLAHLISSGKFWELSRYPGPLFLKKYICKKDENSLILLFRFFKKSPNCTGHSFFLASSVWTIPTLILSTLAYVQPHKSVSPHWITDSSEPMELIADIKGSPILLKSAIFIMRGTYT